MNNFSFGINFKYEGMLAHSFDRFYVVTKFILLTTDVLKFSTNKLDEKCEYWQEKGCNSEAKQYILDLITYCRKIRSFIHYYREQIASLTEQHIAFWKMK